MLMAMKIKSGHAKVVADAVATAQIDDQGSADPHDRVVMFEPERLDRVLRAAHTPEGMLSIRDACQAEMEGQVRRLSADGSYAALILLGKVEQRRPRAEYVIGPDGEIRRLA